MRPPPDKYEDLEYLAQGGMARVYRARRQGSGRVIALREIAGGPGSEARLESEHRGAQVQQALCAVDPRVPQVYDVFFSSDGWLYIEMEYIEGEDLSDRLQRGPLPPAEAVRVAIETGPFALRCGVVWNVTEEDWPFLLYDYRLVLSEDPLSAGEKPLPRELLEHPDLPAETRELFESIKHRAEAMRRYYKGGVELKHREILGMGLPASAFIE